MSDKQSRYQLPYLSDLLINNISNQKDFRNASAFEACILFADISGFTRISEKLVEIGRIGGEKLAQIINQCFDPLTGLVFAYNGDIIKFGGDAFLVMFAGQDRSQRAFKCASDLICWISEKGKIKTDVGEFDLGIHAGIGEGQIFNLVVGETRKEHIFCGKAVEEAYTAADLASQGQIAVKREVIGDQFDGASALTKSGFLIIDPLLKNHLLSPKERLQEIPKIPIDYRHFLITGLLEQLEFSGGTLEGEHRVLTSMFIGLKSLRKNLEADFTKSVEAINAYFISLNRIIENHGGAIARIDNGPSYEKMLVFFGAPRGSERDVSNSLNCALEIEQSLGNLTRNFPLPVKHKYGINTGLCYTGDVGGRKRKEYTAMGDAINLAARLMSRADWGQILAGEQTVNATADAYETSDKGAITVKGKQRPTRIHTLIRRNDYLSDCELMIGRENELKIAREFIKQTVDNKKSYLLVSGEPGIGKSLFSGKLKIEAAGAGLRVIEGECFRQSQHNSHGLIKSLLWNLMDFDQTSSQRYRRAIFQEALKIIGETYWEPILAPMLDYFPSIPAAITNLPDDIKQKKMNDIICRLFCRKKEESNLIITIEDYQWVDEASRAILRVLDGSPTAPSIMFICRPGQFADEIAELADVTRIELGNLDRANSEKLFRARLGGTECHEINISLVIDKSQGNPFYIEEMAKAYRELGPERIFSQGSIPSGIESVITARIDNLGEAIKRTIRTASVIGRVFEFTVLRHIYPDKKRKNQILDHLKRLEQLDLTPIEKKDPILIYIFKHILTQEVAYNGLPYSVRQALHKSIAEYYAGRKRIVRSNPFLTAQHYIEAGLSLNALPYLIMASKKAIREFANKEAHNHLSKIIEISERSNSYEFAAFALKARGKLLKFTGDYLGAEADLKTLKSLAKDDHALYRQSLEELSLLYHQVAEYDKAESALNDIENISKNDIRAKIFCLNGRAEIKRRQGSLGDCRNLLLEALKLFQADSVPFAGEGKTELSAIVYNNLGICHWSLGKLDEAVGYYKEARKLYAKSKDLSGQSKIINNIGIIYDSRGMLLKAANSYEKAEKIFNRIGANRSEGFACANLGTNYRVRGLFTRARKKLSHARDIFTKIGDQSSLAMVIGDLAEIDFLTGEFDFAQKKFATAREMAIALGNEELNVETNIRILRFEFFGSKEIGDSLESLIETAHKIGSPELQIKAKLLKLTSQICKDIMGRVDETIRELEATDEIENFPELALELKKLKAIRAAKNSIREASRMLIDGAKNSASREFVLLAVEFYRVIQFLQVVLPKPIQSRIEKLNDYVKADLGNAEYQSFLHWTNMRMLKLLNKLEPSMVSRKIAANAVLPIIIGSIP